VILDGAPGFFDVYTAADCTIPGIQAYRSSINGGQPFEVPDLRDPEKRAAYREDHFAQPRFDHRNDLFLEQQDHALTEQFSIAMRDLLGTSVAYRAYRDWKKVATDLTEPAIRFSFTRDFISMRN
jgi:catalase